MQELDLGGRIIAGEGEKGIISCGYTSQAGYLSPVVSGGTVEREKITMHFKTNIPLQSGIFSILHSKSSPMLTFLVFSRFPLRIKNWIDGFIKKRKHSISLFAHFISSLRELTLVDNNHIHFLTLFRREFNSLLECIKLQHMYVTPTCSTLVALL